MMRRAVLFFTLLWTVLPAAPARATPRTVTFTGKVVDAGGKPASGARVFLSIPDARPTSRDRNPAWTTVRTTSGPDGTFRLTASVRREDWSGELAATKTGHGPGGQEVRAGAPTTGLILSLTRASFVAGMVVDRAGQPVPAARVRVQWALRPDSGGAPLGPAGEPPAAMTDAAGRFRIAPLPDGCRLHMVIEDPRYAEWNSGDQPISSGATDARIVLPPPGRIVGRVLDMKGQPAANVTVRCQGSGWRDGQTDASGSYRFSNLAAGWYIVTAELPGATPEFAADPQGVVLDEGAELRAPDLRLVRGGILAGKATDDQGRPMAGIVISSSRELFFPSLNMRAEASGPWTETAADGTYRLRLAPGKWSVLPIFVPGGYVSEAQPGSAPERVVAEGQTAGIDLRFYRSAVRVRVVDTRGRPAAGAKARAEVHRGNYGFSEEQTADAAGRFSLIRFLPKDTPQLIVMSRDGSEGAWMDVPPGRGGSRAGPGAVGRGELVVRLRRIPAATGVVRDRGGRPLPGATVIVDRMAFEGHLRPERHSSTTTDAHGRFRVPLLPGAHYRVAVEAAGFGPADRYPVAAGGGPPAPLSFVLERAAGSVAGVVVGPDDRPLAGATVSAYRQGASIVYLFGREVTTDAGGRFRIDKLSPGEVRLMAQRAGFELDSREHVPVGAANVRLILTPRESSESAPSPPAVGARAPEIQVTRWVNDAGVKHLSDLRNKMVVLQFSSAYNRAAEASNAALKRLHAGLQARGRDDVVILALYDASAGADEVAAYAAAEGLRFPIGLVEATRNLGADSASFRAYGVRQLPTLFVIDREGIVRAVNPKPEDLTRLTGG